jgi:hypothetical protein
VEGDSAEPQVRWVIYQPARGAGDSDQRSLNDDDCENGEKLPPAFAHLRQLKDKSFLLFEIEKGGKMI